MRGMKRVYPKRALDRVAILDDGTSWPLPERDEPHHDRAAWVARYQPEKLTATQAMYLANVAGAYEALINSDPAKGQDIARALRMAIVIRDDEAP